MPSQLQPIEHDRPPSSSRVSPRLPRPTRPPCPCAPLIPSARPLPLLLALHALQVVAAAADLTLINMIQNATGVDFFQPYGPRSTRFYTIIAPSDQAIIKAMAGGWLGGVWGGQPWLGGA